MLDQQINEQLSLLQKELLRLKTAVEYIDDAKEKSSSVIASLENVQQNYESYTDKIYNFYKQYAENLSKKVEIQINDGVSKFEATGDKIGTATKEVLSEIRRLLEQYKRIVDSTDNLAKQVESIDFPVRLSNIDKNIQTANLALTESRQVIEGILKENQSELTQQLEQQSSALTESRQVIEGILKENQSELTQQLEQQSSEIKLLKKGLLILCCLIIVGFLTVLLK